jgi:hypothetical protein
MVKKLSTGDITEARCTRCQEIMNHTIVAMIEEKIVRVQCNTCNGVHNYRSPLPAKKATAPKAASATTAKGTPRVSRKDPAAGEKQEWAEQIVKMQPELAIAYSMEGKYKVNSLVKHTTFGLGIVKRQSPGKVEMLFADGKKMLKSQ